MSTFDNEKFLRWPDKVFTPIYTFLEKPKHEWSAWKRKLYLLTFPISFPLIHLFKAAIFCVGFICLFIAFIMHKFYCTWHGRKSGF